MFDPRPLTTGAWATVRDFDATGAGSLVIVDEAGEALGIVDDGVTPSLSPWIPPGAGSLVESDGVVYFVEDEPRRGLWYAEPQ